MAILPMHSRDGGVSRRSAFRLPRRYVLVGFVAVTGLFLLSGPSRPHWRLSDDDDAGFFDAAPAPYEVLPGHGVAYGVHETSADPPPPSPWPARADLVKSAFLHGYMAYDQLAFPSDEFRPLTQKPVNNFNGWGLTAIDALDTMLLMGFNDLAERVVQHAASLRFSNTSVVVPFFETTIRYLGGLLGGYALNGSPILLARADDLGRALLPAFNTTLGLPAFSVNVKTGMTRDGWTGPSVILSEIGSASLEFRALAHYTGRAEYARVVDGVTTFLQNVKHTDGLLPLRYSRTTGRPQDDKASVGAFADSTYEYFLKGWLQTNRTEDRLRDLYLEAADGIIEHLLYVSPKRGLLYVTDVEGRARVPSGTLEHLSCFLAGLFALGHATLPNPPETHLWAAEGLATTCWLTYADTATGLGPDEVTFRPLGGRHELPERRWAYMLKQWEADGRVGVPPGVGDALPVEDPVDIDAREWRSTGRMGYLLRPETVESLFVLHRVTRDPKWRERAWQIFEAIERHARLEVGYATVHDVTVPATARLAREKYYQNEMASWFFAETLKYFYLLFSDDAGDEETIALDRWVLTTEAHPLPVFEWSAWEREAFGITLHATPPPPQVEEAAGGAGPEDEWDVEWKPATVEGPPPTVEGPPATVEGPPATVEGLPAGAGRLADLDGPGTEGFWDPHEFDQ